MGLGGCLGVWPRWFTGQPPEAFGFFPPFPRGISGEPFMPPGGTTKNENIPRSKGDSDLARDREGDVSVGCARGSCDRDTPLSLRLLSPFIKRGFQRNSYKNFPFVKRESFMRVPLWPREDYREASSFRPPRHLEAFSRLSLLQSGNFR